MDAAEVVERIWARDATLWTGSDEAQWLGWLDEPSAHAGAAAGDPRVRRRGAGGFRRGGAPRHGRLQPRPGGLQARDRLGGLPRPRHDAPRGGAPARGVARPRADALRRLVEVRDHARDALAPRLLLGADARSGRVVRGDHGSRLGAGGAGGRARVPRGLPRGAFDRRALLGALAVRSRAGGADGRRRRGAAGGCGGDGGAVPVGGEPGSRARPRARRRLAGGARQGRLRQPARLRALAGAVARRVHGQAGQGPRPGARERPGRPRPPGRGGHAGARPRRRDVPLGGRRRRSRRRPRHQPVRPAQRPGGQGPHPGCPFRPRTGSDP